DSTGDGAGDYHLPQDRDAAEFAFRRMPQTCVETERQAENDGLDGRQNCEYGCVAVTIHFGAHLLLIFARAQIIETSISCVRSLKPRYYQRMTDPVADAALCLVCTFLR